ncbi:MAG: Ig-like domain-containing protein [Lachnospiraceae bacterium]|nr:Ig-like domain-containing protein [Lachnospiraceae bacterium]
MKKRVNRLAAFLMMAILTTGSFYVYAEDDNTEVLLLTEEETEGAGQAIQGSGEARDSQPVIREGEKLCLVKGQVFTLENGWSCKDSILSVSKKGVARAKKIGTATLVYGNDEKTIDVNIIEPTVSSKIPSLPVGVSENIYLNCDKDLPVLWYSEAPNIATVDQDGNVTGHSNGTAKVNAMVNGKTYTCKVKVVEETSLPERDLYLNVKDTKAVKLKGLKKTVWTISGNETEGGEIVKIKGNKITGSQAGDVILLCEGYLLKVHVEDPAIKGSTKPYSQKLTMAVGEVTKDAVSLNSVQQPVIFKSSKNYVAYIDDDGFIHARSKGTAKITAKVNGKTVRITVKVE